MAKGSGHHWQPPKTANPSVPTMKRPHFGSPNAHAMGSAPPSAGVGLPHSGSPTTPGGRPGSSGGGGLPHFARRGK